MAQSRHVRLAGIVTRTPAAAVELARAHGLGDESIHALDDIESVARDPDIEAVHICLPVGLHASYASTALAIGKHVLREKPLAGDAEEAERLTSGATGDYANSLSSSSGNPAPETRRACFAMLTRMVTSDTSIRD